jgi:hypothetical protein
VLLQVSTSLVHPQISMKAADAEARPHTMAFRSLRLVEEICQRPTQRCWRPVFSSRPTCLSAYTNAKSSAGIRHKPLSRRIESKSYATLLTAAWPFSHGSRSSQRRVPRSPSTSIRTLFRLQVQEEFGIRWTRCESLTDIFEFRVKTF